MKKIYFILSVLLLGAMNSNSQAVGDYRSDSDGNWNSIGTWDVWDGNSWENATAGQGYPGQNGVPGSVTIRNNDAVSLNVTPANNIGALVIEGGNEDSRLSINSGQTLTVNGSVTINAGTGSGSSGDDKIIAVGAGTLVCGSLTIEATSNDAIDSEVTISTGTVTVTGDITMNGTAARNVIRFSGAGTLNVGGDVAAGGDIFPASATSGLVNYNGTSGDQIVKSDTYADITFSGGASKTIATGSIIITDVATFTNGVVISATGSSITINDNATVTGASNASYVDGPVTKLGNNDFTFPVGDPLGSYHRLRVDNSGGANGDSYTVEYFRTSALIRGPASTGIFGVSNCEHWEVLQNATGGNNPDISVSWTADSPCGSSYVTQLLGLTPVWFNGTNWVIPSGTGTDNTGNTTDGESQRDGASQFGYWALGNVAANGSPLPVKIGSIKAYEKMNGIQLDWTAFTEFNVEKYIIERSANGTQFAAIGDVAALNSPNATSYGFFDASPLPGISYYRLRNLDMDGKSGYSNIMRVDLRKGNNEITLYPNPVRISGMVSYNSANLQRGNYTTRIFNAAGQQVYVQRFSHNGGSINQTIQLPANVRTGYYTLQLELEGAKLAGKTFMVQ